MDGQDDESDKGEGEEDSDEAQAEVDRRVAQMLQNQQNQYLHMCSSSAHILQLLSHLVPGMALSGQVMGLESVTEDSEEATSRSDSASSSHSPATSDDNTGCVLWAEPIMTCQLMPTWKPFCSDVRRLPPGVKPEDLKCQHTPTCRNPSISSYYPATAAAAAAAAARNRRPCAASGNGGVAHLSNINPGSASRDTNAHTSHKEDGSGPCTTERSRSERNPTASVLEDKTSKSSESTNIQKMCTSAGTTSKVPNAADAIRKTKTILAAVTSGRQANNNNNPEETSRGKGSKRESDITRQELGSSDKDVNGNTGQDGNAGRCNADSRTYPAGPSKNNPKVVSFKAHKETSPRQHFPAPILVKAAGVQTDTVPVRCEETEDSTGTTHVTESISRAGNPINNTGSTSNVFEICDQTSQTDEFSTQTSIVRKSDMPARRTGHDTTLWGPMAAQPEAQSSRLVRRSRPNRQLYRYSGNNCAGQPGNRTQQSVSLGCVQPEKRIHPPPVNLSPGTQTTRPPAHEQLELDFSYFNIGQNTHRSTRKHPITLAHLKNALNIAKHNLQKINKWTVKETSLVKEPSPQTRSTVSTFTITEVESLNIFADHAEKDSVTSETVETILSDMIYEGTDAADVKASGDASNSTADSITEVENILYVQHPSPHELGNDLEVCADSLGVSCNDREGRASDRNRTNSSCQHQKDVLICSRCSSAVFESREDRPGSSSPTFSKDYDQTTGQASHQQLLHDCHTEVTCMRAESTAAGYLPVKDREARVKLHSGEMTAQEEVNHNEALAGETIVLHKIPNTDETPVRHSQSNTTRWKKEILSSNSHCLHVNLKLSRAKSAGNSVCDEQHKNRTKPCRPYSAGEKTTLEGDKDFHNVVVVKQRNDFPPHFPGAGDAVENIPVLDSIKSTPCGASQLGVVRNEIQTHNTPNWKKVQQNEPAVIKATECGRKQETKQLRKRNLQKTAKRLVFIHTGKSNNASLERENTISKTTSENELLDLTLLQSKNHEAQHIAIEDSEDNVSQSKFRQGNQTHVSHLRDTSCTVPLKVSVKQTSIADDDVRNHRHNYTCEGNHPDNASPISDLSNSVISLPHETPIASQSTEDVILDTTEKSADMRAMATETSRSASDSFIMSHRRTRRRVSKCENTRESMSTQDSKLTDEMTPGDVIVSRSNCAQYLDMIPGFMPSENRHIRPKIRAASTKNILIWSELRDIPLTTMEGNSKATYSEKLDKELELSETAANLLVISAMADNGSPDSSKSSSIQSPSVTQDATLAPALVASSIVNTPSAAPLVSQEPTSNPGGLKSRLRRFFSQCLHPFSHRN